MAFRVQFYTKKKVLTWEGRRKAGLWLERIIRESYFYRARREGKNYVGMTGEAIGQTERRQRRRNDERREGWHVEVIERRDGEGEIGVAFSSFRIRRTKGRAEEKKSGKIYHDHKEVVVKPDEKTMTEEILNSNKPYFKTT